MDYLLDKSVIFSFDKSGYERHALSYDELAIDKNLGSVLITGGSSGIGKACADFLLEQNNHCIVTGRDESKFTQHERLQSYALDLSDWSAVTAFVDELGNVDHLVLNAGGMPDDYRENDAGCEYQCASQLVGHLLLFRQLHESGKMAAGAKVVFVSSGGMLMKKLDPGSLFQNREYDKVSQYANVKRAQVIMNECYALRFPDYYFAAMHPGWVATRALQEALPGFTSWLASRLRNHYQGADTILWLLYRDSFESGRFWFDRQLARTDPLPWTRSSHEDREVLEQTVESYLNECGG